MSFEFSQKEVECWEQNLEINGLPNQQPSGTSQGKIHVHPQRLVSTRHVGIAPFGLGMLGGVDIDSEEFVKEGIME